MFKVVAFLTSFKVQNFLITTVFFLFIAIMLKKESLHRFRRSCVYRLWPVKRNHKHAGREIIGGEEATSLI